MAGAKLKGVRRARNLRHGQRGVTMLRPICDVCQSGHNVAWNWYETCPHDPYVGIRTESRSVPIYRDADDGSGEKIVERMEERSRIYPWPNFANVTVSTRVNSGQGVAKAKNKGFILLHELTGSEAFPDGIAPMCEYRDCQWQEDLKVYKWGTFCREQEARMVGIDEEALDDALEVGFNAQSTSRRNRQIASVSI